MPFEPFMGEIMYVAGSFPPKGWAACDGQLLPIQSYQPLFSLLGTNFGGNGTSTFGLPDLRGRAILGTSGNAPLGSLSGSESVALQINEMPPHNHSVFVTDSAGTTPTPSNGAVLGGSSGTDSDGGSFPVNLYSSALTNPSPVATETIGVNGSGQGHENRQPFNTLMACIALVGVYPSRS